MKSDDLSAAAAEESARKTPCIQPVNVAPEDSIAADGCHADAKATHRALRSSFVKAEARRLGFAACGIARAEPVAEPVAAAYRQWIAKGGHAAMGYLANNIDKRLDPTLLLPGAKSIIVVALNYAPARRFPPGEFQLAAYALGRDYHDVVKKRLRQLLNSIAPDSPSPDSPSAQLPNSLLPTSLLPTSLLPNSFLHNSLLHNSFLHNSFLPTSFKIATDTVPLLERYWAVQAGLGFIGRNHQLIIPHAGSMFFLGEIVTTAEAEKYDEPCRLSCGGCNSCLKACPTGALQPGGFCSERCLSYQTIENRGPLSDMAKAHIGRTIYGCDRCQTACPWNRFATPTDVAELQPSEALMQMRRADWQNLTTEQYKTLFTGSAVKRAKYEGLMRNIEAAMKCRP